MESAAILGHRPERFRFKGRETDPLCRLLQKALAEQATTLYAQGVRQFCCGPSPGVGFWVGDAVLSLKAKHPDLKLACFLPFKGCDENWSPASRSRYSRLLDACDTVCFSSAFAPTESRAIAAAYKRRDYRMVDQAEHLIAVYDQDRSVRTQIGQTVNYARSKGRSIRYIHPDTAEITEESENKKARP